MKKHLFMLLPAICMALQSCSTSNVIPVGPDTYMVTSSGAGFSEGPTLENVYGKANAFCAERGLVMVPADIDSQRGIYGQQPPSARLTFRALKPGDPRIKSGNSGTPDAILRVQHR